MSVGGYLMIDLEGTVFGQTSGVVTNGKLVNKILDTLVSNAGKKATLITNFTASSFLMPATPVTFSVTTDGNNAQGLALFNLSDYFLIIRIARGTGNLRYTYKKYTQES